MPQAPEVALADHDNGFPNTDIDERMDVGRRETNLSLGTGLLQSPGAHDFTSGQSDHDRSTQTQIPASDLSNELNLSGNEPQSYDVWPPFFHPTLLDTLPDSEMLNLPQVVMDPTDLDYFEPENWFMYTNP